MKVIISNDKTRLYANADYVLSARTKVNGTIASSITVFNVINSSGISANDYIQIGDFGADSSEIIKINSVVGNAITLSAGTSFAHDTKTNIFRMVYNQIKFYEDDTVLGTQDIKADYYTMYSKSVITDESKQYSIGFYNSTSTKESPRGEKIYGYEYQLCSAGDISKYESIDILGYKIIDKIDIASQEIRNTFIKQDQKFTDIDNRDLFRQPTALLALHYIFLELIKNPDDIASMKAKRYLELYNAKNDELSAILKATETDVSYFTQTRCLR